MLKLILAPAPLPQKILHSSRAVKSDVKIVDFINDLRVAFTLEDPKIAKKTLVM